MKVLHLQKVAGIGGSERHLLSLLPALRERGIEAAMGVLREGNYRPFVEALTAAGVDTFTVPAGSRFNPRLVRQLAGRIRSFGPDLVHTHLMHADLYGQLAARLSRTAAVSSVHSAHRFYSRFPYRLAAKLAGRLTTTTIAISQHVAEYLIALKISHRSKVRVIHYGIDTTDWTVEPAEREGIRAEYGLKADDIVLGMAARIVPYKGHDFLIRAFARAYQSDARLKLLIAGEGPLKQQLQDHVRELPCSDAIRFLGYVSEVRGFMNACDVVGVPSMPGDGEGFGLAAIEAMACAKPVIATDTDSLPEIVLEDETGLLVKPNDAESLAQTLLRLAGDPNLAQRLGAAGRRRVDQRFSLGPMVDRTIAAYEDSLAP